MELELITRRPARPRPDSPRLLLVHGICVGAWVWEEHVMPWFAARVQGESRRAAPRAAAGARADARSALGRRGPAPARLGAAAARVNAAAPC